MPYNGSGTFVRVHNWEQDADNGIGILADRHDDEDDGFATGLSTALTKDGQTTATANQPMGGFRHTGVGNASARTHYGVVGQLQDGSYIYATSGGSANAYTLTLAPAITAYAAGQEFSFKANHDSTAASTLNVSGLGAVAIKKLLSTDIAADDIKTGQIIEVRHDGTNFQMLNPSGTAAAGRTTLGLGTIATQAASNVTITGGSITGITDLAIADGGTGASTASAAFDALKQAATDSSTGVVEKATSAEVVSETADKYPDAALLKYHPGAAKAWVNFNGTGTVAIRDSYNVSSITDSAAGTYVVNFSTSFGSANYAVAGWARTPSGGAGTASFVSGATGQANPTASACPITVFNGGSANDETYITAVFFGDL